MYQIKRLRLIDDEPVILETTYIPESKFKNFNCKLLNERAMYDIFKNDYNIIAIWSKRDFRAIMIDSKEDKKYLNLDKNTVGMQIIRIAYSDCKVVEYTKSHSLRVFEFTVKLSEVCKWKYIQWLKSIINNALKIRVSSIVNKGRLKKLIH